MKTLDFTGVSDTPKQKAAFGWSDLIFAIYTVLSWISRGLTVEIVRNFNWLQALGITLGFSIFLTFVFIWVSNLFKIDWYGKKSKKGLIFYVLNFFSKNITKKKLLKWLFGLDPFLFYIQLRNGNHGFINIVKRWVLLTLSLLFVALVWLAIGELKKLIF